MQLASTASAHQPAFTDEEDEWSAHIAARLGRAVVRIRREMRRHGPDGLTVSQLALLHTTIRAGPVPIGQLAGIEGLPAPSIPRLVDRLERDGLVLRAANPQDRRRVLVQASSAGSQRCAADERAGNGWLARRLQRLALTECHDAELGVALIERLAGEEADRQGPDQEKERTW